MFGKVFLNFLSVKNIVRPQYGPNLWGRLNYRFYSTVRKMEWTKNENFERKSNMETLLSFEDFKRKYVESLDSFKNSPAVKTVCGDDLEKISKAYERFCLSQYSLYKHQAYGGNPSLMT